MSNPLSTILSSLLKKQGDLMQLQIHRDKLNLDLYYVQETTDIARFNDFYISRITADNYETLTDMAPGVFVTLTEYTDNYCAYLLGKGNMILIINDTIFYQINLPKLPKRNVENSQLDPTNLLDSRDGFVENIHDNLALIRKRLKNKDLVTKKYLLGSISQTDAFLLYLDDKKEKPYLKEIMHTLDHFPSDIISNINDLNSAFSHSLLLPLVFNTSSPEHIFGALLEGRAVILIDNSPIASVLPATLTSFTTIKNEMNAPKYYTLFGRLFVVLFFFTALFLLGFFLSLINFSPTFLSTLLIANIQLTERGTTFPLFIESIAILCMFEFYRLTTSRSPTNYVQNIVIIFGGLFIGQNAIESGVVGSLILLLTSLSYVSSFAITNNPHLITSLSIFRVFNLVLSYTFGLFGFAIGFFTTLAYFGTQKSVGVSFLEPFSPLSLKGIKHFFFPRHGDETNE